MMWLAFAAGLFLGTFAGIFVLGLFHASAKYNERDECQFIPSRESESKAVLPGGDDVRKGSFTDHLGGGRVREQTEILEASVS